MKKLLFSVIQSDCEMQTFRCGGNGGQRLNSTDTGVRFVHKPSGAVGQACDGRKQIDNKRLAWKRMAMTKEMQTWLRLEAARRLGQPSIDDRVNDLMRESNIRIEKLENNKWTKYE